MTVNQKCFSWALFQFKLVCHTSLDMQYIKGFKSKLYFIIYLYVKPCFGKSDERWEKWCVRPDINEKENKTVCRINSSVFVKMLSTLKGTALVAPPWYFVLVKRSFTVGIWLVQNHLVVASVLPVYRELYEKGKASWTDGKKSAIMFIQYERRSKCWTDPEAAVRASVQELKWKFIQLAMVDRLNRLDGCQPSEFHVCADGEENWMCFAVTLSLYPDIPEGRCCQW